MKTAADIMQDALTLKEEKAQDYLGSEWNEEDYFPYGHQSYVTFLWTKMLRIRSVVDQEETNFESLDDSLIDLINYAAMYAAWIANQKADEELYGTEENL